MIDVMMQHSACYRNICIHIFSTIKMLAPINRQYI